MLLITTTHTNNQQKPYFGITKNMFQRMVVYKQESKNDLNDTKFMEVYKKYPLAELASNSLKCSQTISLTLEGILITFTGLENTLNICKMSMSTSDFNEITLYTTALILYSVMSNNILYENHTINDLG